MIEKKTRNWILFIISLDSSHSDHGGKNNSNRKHVHRNNGDQSSYNNNNTNKTMAKIISSGVIYKQNVFFNY
jgi:hypothetical protein